MLKNQVQGREKGYGEKALQKGQYLVLNELVMQFKKKKNLHQLVSLAAVDTPTKELLPLLSIMPFFDS